ncbi:MAG: VWA domain-containing protein [Terriglobales bacterium]
MNWLRRALVLVILVTVCTAENVVYVRVHRQLIEDCLKLAPATEAESIRVLRNLFQQAGCPQLLEQQVPNQDFPNLICVLPGDEEGTIVVGAGSDYASPDPVTPGGWSSLAMLPLLAESLSHVPHRLTLMFTAFVGHEHAAGASWYTSHLTDVQRKSIQAMVDVDDLGRTPPVFGLAQTDDTLATWLQVASQSLRVSAPDKVDNIIDASFPLQNGIAASHENPAADIKPFQQAHIPAVAIHSAIPAQRLNGAAQATTQSVFDIDTYEDTYRLLCVYVLYLDRNLGKPLIAAGIYSGKIVDTAGVFPTSPVDVSVKIDRLTTTGELNRFELILKKRGQEALADALSDENEKGVLRFGLDLGYGIKLATVQTSANTIFLVAPRVKDPGSIPGNYRFTVVKLNLDGKGNGDGLFYSSAKLGFSKNHELIIEDFGSRPDIVRQVHLERPSVPRTNPATVVASVSGAPGGGASAPALAVPKPDSAPAAKEVQQKGNLYAAVTGTIATPTFHTKAQLVQVDIAVADAQGQPIRGLQQSDFTVMEDGKPQEIRAFEAHVPAPKGVDVKTAAPPTLALPPNTYTNRVVVPAEDTLNILLLDLLNTPVSDQAHARKQTIEFLKTLPPGKRIAMFVLSGKLVMVQGFTEDSGTLVAAAEKVLNDRSLLLTTEAERQQFQGAAESVSRIASPDGSAPGGGVPAGTTGGAQSGSSDWGFSQARERSNAMMEGDRTSNRVNFTLDALAALARAVTSYPGRKNLIWMSGSFPVRLKPSGIDFYHLNSANSSATTGLVDTPDFGAAVKVATTALATARIAVFPIDVRGLTPGGVDIAIGAAESASLTATDSPEAYKQNLNTQSETRFTERSSMEEVAQQTGGEVLWGNDVRGAIAHAIADGSTYYTIAYTPKEEATPRFRKIEVKVNREKVKLAYRPGYFSGADQSSPTLTARPLIVAMQPGMPASTVIPLTVQVLPADDASKKIKITYTIDIQNVNFADTPDHKKRAVIDCIAVAFNKEGIPVGQISNAMDATLSLAEYESSLRTGLGVSQELALPAGRYSLRVGVMDRGSQKIGTLDVPLAVAPTTASK